MRKIFVLFFTFVALTAAAIDPPIGWVRGDANGDGRVTLADVTWLVMQMNWKGEHLIYMNDMDEDNRLTHGDVQFVVDVLLNRHEAVDLGLSVCWATMNIGATSAEAFGDYFAWGETQPKTSYTEENYLYCANGAFQSIGNSIGGTKYDVATALWGDGWRLPTLIDINELKTKCTWTAVTRYGVKAYKVTGPNGNSIYLPLSGYRTGTSKVGVGDSFYYWSSMKPSTASAAYCLYSQNYTGNWSANRAYGFPVRPVRSKK